MPSSTMDGWVSALGLSLPEGGLSGALAIGVAAKLLAALSWLALFLLIVVIYVRRPDLFVRQTYLLLGAVFGLNALASLLTVLPLEPAALGVALLAGAAQTLSAAMLWYRLPQSLKLPTRHGLQAANQRLEAEIAERVAAQEALRTLNAELEARVAARTAELTTSNAGLMAEIAEKQALTTELARARDQAEGANRVKSMFLASMSHDLRTPLNAIIGFSEIMREEILGPVAVPKYREYLGDIHNSAQHLLLIINDILDIARIEAGRVELKEARIDLRRMIDESARMLRGRVAEAGLTLETSFENEAPWCIGDERLLRQVLLNLTSNAIKFTPSGGRVRILVGRRVGGELTLAVQDTGIGMTAEEAAVALRPFGQVQSAFARSRDGVGLGLPLAKSFVELHGGELLVESMPGRGTTITVKLPPWRAAQALG